MAQPHEHGQLSRLERQSLEDPQTGLANARHFEESLAAVAAGARQGEAPVFMAIVAVDLSRHGEGAPAGRASLLRETAHVLRARLDPRHFIGHLGDAEFGILFRGLDAEAAASACGQLCHAVEQHDWAAVHPWIKLGASAGLAEVGADGDAAWVLRVARNGVEASKAAGGGLAGFARPWSGTEAHAAQARELIHGEQLRASYANLPLIFSMSLVAAAMLCLVVRDMIAFAVWGPWLAAMAGVCIGLLALCHRFQRLRPTGAAVRRWGAYAVAACTAAGLLWGIGAVKLHTPDSIDYQILVAVTAALVASCSAFGSAAYLPAFYAFFLPAALPSAIIFLQKDDATRVVAGLLLIFYVPVVTRFAITVNRAFMESLRLRFQNIALVGELRDKKQAAENASVAKSRFLAAASHDLRQPMHALGLFLQSLRQGRLAERERDLVEKIAASYDAMEALFDALLDVSRLDAGIVEPRLRIFAVQRMLDRVRMDYEAQAAGKGLALAIKPCKAFVRSDPTLLEEIVGNFVSNAVRHTRRGRIVVGCRRAGARLHIEVWDTGPGIPRDKQSDVFRDFVQLGNPERDRRQGLGLGLAIVERLSRLLDHPIELRSAPGRGSMFRVTVPRVARSDVAAAPVESESHVAQVEPFNGRLVVVVDDDAAALLAMEGLLAEWGCSVECAESGALIMARLASAARRPDLILCDYRLRGGESGLNVIAEIRAEFNEDIPAALITGDTGPERLKEARESGLPLLHKPLKPPRLRALMAQLLAQGRGETAASEPPGRL